MDANAGEVVYNWTEGNSLQSKICNEINGRLNCDTVYFKNIEVPAKLTTWQDNFIIIGQLSVVLLAALFVFYIANRIIAVHRLEKEIETLKKEAGEKE
jgi:hypothetical protein